VCGLPSSLGVAVKGYWLGVIRKNAFILVLGLAALYAFSPLSFEDVAHLRWLDDLSAIANNLLAPVKSNPGVSPVDPIAAANVEEDMDYRIAQRLNSSEAWSSFLATHPAGTHAAAARAEIDKVLAVEKSPAPTADQTPDRVLSDTKTSSVEASSERPSVESEVVANEICERDKDRLNRLFGSATSGEAMRFLTELRCEKLSPKLFRLTERLDYQAPVTAAVAGQRSSSTVAAVEQNKTLGWLSSRSLHRSRWTKRRTAPNLPPILLALFGEQPRNSSTFPVGRGSGSGRWGGSVGRGH
jgi:hypothetical protein